MSSDMRVKSGFDWSTYHHGAVSSCSERGRERLFWVAAMLKRKHNKILDASNTGRRC